MDFKRIRGGFFALVVMVATDIGSFLPMFRRMERERTGFRRLSPGLICRGLSFLGMLFLASTVSWSPVRAAGSEVRFRLQTDPVWHFSWGQHAASGSTLLAGDETGVWILDLETRVLLRLGMNLAVVSSIPMPKTLAPSLMTRHHTLHLLSFGKKGVWLLSPGSRQIWRYKDEMWSEPSEVQFPFASGAAMAGEALVVNVPSAERPIVVLDAQGKKIRDFGQREPAGCPELEDPYGHWMLASGDNQVTAVHQFLPLLERYFMYGVRQQRMKLDTPFLHKLEEGHQKASEERVMDQAGHCLDYEFIHFAESIQSLPDGSVVVNFSNAPRFLRIYPKDRGKEEYLLKDVPRSSGTGWAYLDNFGFAMIGDRILTSVQGEIRVFNRVVGDGLVGRVVDPAQRPLPGARVDLETGAKQVITDQSGMFVMEGEAKDALVALKVSRAGFLKEDLHGRLGKILEDPIVLRLQPRICVTVLDAATEEPVTDYHLSVDQNRRYSTPGMSTIGVVEGPAKSIHSTDGRGCLSAPWEGPFLVTVTAQGYAQEKRRVGRRQDLPVLLGPEARLTVHVQDSEGEPSGGVHVLIGEPGAVNRHTWQPIYQAVADEQGTAQFIGVAPETWDLVLTTSESGIEAKRQIDLDPGDNEVTVTLDPCVDVQVTVLDQEGTPVPQVEVDLSPQSASLRTPGTCTTSALGRCVLQRMVMGKMPPTPCSQTRPSEKRSGSRRANRCRRSHSRSLKAMI